MSTEGEAGGKLSGGERQRIANEHLIQNAISQLARRLGFQVGAVSEVDGKMEVAI